MNGTSSLAGALHHLSTFWAAKDRSNVVFLHYDDLKTDLEGQMRVLADRLGIQIAETTWPELVQAAGERPAECPDPVGGSAGEIGAAGQGFGGDRRGGSGWRRRLGCKARTWVVHVPDGD